MADTRWVFVSLSTCGHAQSVYADIPQVSGESLDSAIMGDLRLGLVVKRITLQEFQEKYASMLLCGCPTVGHENEAALRAGEVQL